MRDKVTLLAGNHLIQPTVTERLLGCNIHQGLKWKQQVLTNDSYLNCQLTSCLYALKKIATNATFKTRLKAAIRLVLINFPHFWYHGGSFFNLVLAYLINKPIGCMLIFD